MPGNLEGLGPYHNRGMRSSPFRFPRWVPEEETLCIVPRSVMDSRWIPEEETLDLACGVADGDIDLVVAQTGCTRRAAREALAKHNSHIVDAVMDFPNAQLSKQPPVLVTEEENPDSDTEPLNKDVELVMSQSGSTSEAARDALAKHNGDIICAIIDLCP